MKAYQDWAHKTSETGYLLRRIQEIVKSIDPEAQVVLYRLGRGGLPILPQTGIF